MKLVRVRNGSADTVTVTFDGRPLPLPRDMNLAAGLLEAGIGHFRDTPRNGAPRGPFCMMGVCFDCLMVIDGIPNVQACLTMPGEGMVISRQAQNTEGMG